jgi:hypothetical protein
MDKIIGAMLLEGFHRLVASLRHPYGCELIIRLR